MLPALVVAAALAWAWPVYFAGAIPGGDSDRARPGVLRGGHAWSGAAQEAADRQKRALKGTVTHVRDGDTIEVRSTPIRLANLDCAEAGTAIGDRATQHMRELVNSRRVTCSLSGKSSFDRQVGHCQLPNGQDIGDALIMRGVCDRWR